MNENTDGDLFYKLTISTYDSPFIVSKDLIYTLVGLYCPMTGPSAISFEIIDSDLTFE